MKEKKMTKKIFVLGDSRTGTTSLHKLFMDYGFKSVHYFVEEVKDIAKRDGCDQHQYKHIRHFIHNSGFEAFTDYPTRSYFRQLRRDFPDAYFILSRRKDVPTWVTSMKRFFPARDDVLSNMEHLAKVYRQVNQQIRDLYADADHFIEVCIDDGNEINSEKIKVFLGEENKVYIKKLNAT